HTRCYRDWSSDVCSSDLILAGVRRKMQSVFAGLGIDVFEQFGRALHFVAADTKACDIAIAKLYGKIHNLLCFLGSELTDCIEDRSEERRVGKMYRSR